MAVDDGSYQLYLQAQNAYLNDAELHAYTEMAVQTAVAAGVIAAAPDGTESMDMARVRLGAYLALYAARLNPLTGLGDVSV